MNDALVREYRELLRSHGVEHLVERKMTPEEYADVVESVRRQLAQAAADYGEKNLLGETPPDDVLSGRHDPHARRAEKIESAVRGLGLDLPGPVHLGEWPHHSFNAQARRMRNGTLLLVNVGVPMLLTEVALALSTRVVIVDPEGGGDWPPRQTETHERRAKQATENLANSLAAYLLYTDSRKGGRQQLDGTGRGAIAFMAADAAQLFAVAHEYGHFLAGHLDQPRPTGSEWLRKSHEQEFEADEIGMLLALEVQKADEQIAGGPFLRTNIAVLGAFLFFAIDHLLTRVRDEVPELGAHRIVSDHPRSDLRAAALRRTVVELEGPDVFQLADAFVPNLAAQEDHVIASLRSLLRG
ncbi:hypothetical protein SAMN05216553_108443 [Lentzea fradiae]|uniref:Uncharacterized protein n=1 Tax=Lentzea fradiae TaxID=200378 RepID=A0A1G7UWD9_9PSEU|nr:hypothetical protein [Lentzea fradiae]SDG51601.1 hypothetical protein SAMN05216553_108443 [Lentzea fradiae]